MGPGTLQGGVRTPVGKLPLRRPRPSGLQHPACPAARSLWGEWVLGALGFSRQKYWGGLPFPSPGPTQESNLGLCLIVTGRLFTY